MKKTYTIRKAKNGLYWLYKSGKKTNQFFFYPKAANAAMRRLNGEN